MTINEDGRERQRLLVRGRRLEWATQGWNGTEGRVTPIDAILATAALIGLVLNGALGWWWADPAAGYVLVYCRAREAGAAFTR